jgi:hypothetical protein
MGTWYQLWDTIQLNYDTEQQPVYGRVGPPVACPRDGTPLIPGNGLDPTVELFCTFDGYQYPRDFIEPESNCFG